MDAAYLGLIEGFYGKTYTYTEHEFLFDFLSQSGYSFFIYGPKEDRQLRDQWEQEITADYRQQLQNLSERCHARKLDFGIALSPLNLTANFAQQKDLLLQRLSELCAIAKPEIVCILFDDMDKTSEDVGAVQNKIIKLVEQSLPSYVKHFIVCPSYYTDDPILDRLFGQRPDNYFTELMDTMPERVEIFWTGPKVLSPDYPEDHIAKVTAMLGRPPFLWDNYPVNDGHAIHYFVYLKKFQGRTGLTGKVTGHAINPMVQCYLSTLSAKSLPLIYQGLTPEQVDQEYAKYAQTLFGKAADALLQEQNLELLSKVGTAKMTAEQKQQLMDICKLDSTPALLELEDFLTGHSQRFDQKIVNRQHHTTVKES